MKNILAMLASCTFANVTQAAVQAQTDNGFQLENQVEVKASAIQAYKALTGNVAPWWPADHSRFGSSGNFSTDARPGGCSRVRQRYTESGFVTKPFGEFVSIVDKVQGQQLQALANFINTK